MKKKGNEIKNAIHIRKVLETTLTQCVDWDKWSELLIDLIEPRRKKAVITHPEEFIKMVVTGWEAGHFTIPENNTIAGLSEFLYEKCLFVSQKNPDRYLSLTSITRRIYEEIM